MSPWGVCGIGPPVTKPLQPSVRTLRVGEEMRHILAEVLGRGALRDDVIAAHIISVTEVRVSPDLKIATVFVRAMGVADHAPLVKALAANAKALRAEIARRVNLRYTPQLRFRVDESFDTAGRIDAVLRRPEIARDLKPGDEPDAA